MKVLAVMVMILYQGGSITEHTYHDGISSCLKQKREIARHGWKDSLSTRYACEKRWVEIYWDTKEIVNVVDD